jgi:hypothetical protein
VPKCARQEKTSYSREWAKSSGEALAPLKASTLKAAAAFFRALDAQADNSPA